MKLVWATDLHLDHASEHAQGQFIRQVVNEGPDGLVVSGDFAEARSLELALRYLYEELEIPIYFVLGNHDFYGGSFESTRANIKTLCEQNPHFIYLNNSVPVTLSDEWGLVGEDAWADGTIGNFLTSYVKLRDFHEIKDLKFKTPQERLEIVADLGELAAENARAKLALAFENFSKVLFVTHPPPFKEASLYGGELADDDWAPFFVCGAMGKMLLAEMEKRPDKHLMVICGHSHHSAYYKPLENLEVKVGGAIYGAPKIEQTMTFS